MANAWIMVVDDDVMNLQNAGDILREAGYRVATARSGKDLLAFTEKHRPDLILLDILMPEMNGFETFRKLREAEAGRGEKEVPVIFLTGENDSESETKGLTLGASDYVRKPFNRDILLRRIQNTIQNSRTIENLSEEAVTDRLTGFLNKAGTLKKLSVLCRSERGMLTILDLDSFKLVNDIYGHDMGDRVLRSFAELVRKNTGPEDVLCRIGGDEFLAFLRERSREEDVAQLALCLNEQLSAACKEMMGEEFGIPVGVSVGAVQLPENGSDYELLLPLADKALYRVKQNGKHGYALYSEELFSEAETESLDIVLAKLSQILDERGESAAALRLGQDAFAGVYRFLKRRQKASGKSAAKLLFDLRAKTAGAGSAEAAEALGEILDGLLAGDDVIFKSGASQFFLLLPGKTKEAAEALAEQVQERFTQCGCAESCELGHVTEVLG
ncbi:MAG: diguanylate cyclase [Lachnospiraceae bacterium]|nr:diguanylate cyclase [Lachnospiraceae bacterium]